MEQNKKTLFITGASGFIGSNFIEKLRPNRYKKIYCLSRSENTSFVKFKKYPNVVLIKASLSETNLYRDYVQDSDMVINFAAITGKAEPDKYFETNTKGLGSLIELCKESNVKSILHVSTIAVKYESIKHYYYAQSKQQAESLLRRCGINYTIVRPTMVFGRESPIFNNFLKLSQGPLAVVFGKGNCQIQPVYVDDLVDVLLHVVNNKIFINEIYEIGGSEKISIKKFQKKVHNVYYNQDPIIIHLPLKILIKILPLLERKLLSLLPFTSGQLSSFNNDSTIEKNKVHDGLKSQMKTIDETLAIIKTQYDRAEAEKSILAECRILCRYLTGKEPDKYVTQKYHEGIVSTPELAVKNPLFLERIIFRIGLTSPFFTHFMDAYTSIFLKSCAFRKRLILLIAILECCPAYFQFVEQPDTSLKSVFYLKLMQKLCYFVFFLLISAILLLPFHLVSILPKKIDAKN